MSKNVEELVRKIISENSDSRIKADKIDPNENLQDLGINSSSFIKTVIGLEKAFNLEFDDESLNPRDFETLQSIISYIEKRI